MLIAATSTATLTLWDHVRFSQRPSRQQALELLHSEHDKRRVTGISSLFDDVTEAIAELQTAAQGEGESAEHAQIALRKIRERLR